MLCGCFRVFSIGYTDSGRLLPLTADGAGIDFLHISLHTLIGRRGHTRGWHRRVWAVRYLRIAGRLVLSDIERVDEAAVGTVFVVDPQRQVRLGHDDSAEIDCECHRHRREDIDELVLPAEASLGPSVLA